jgi:hypothetical protein
VAEVAQNRVEAIDGVGDRLHDRAQDRDPRHRRVQPLRAGLEQAADRADEPAGHTPDDLAGAVHHAAEVKMFMRRMTASIDSFVSGTPR